MVATRSPIGDLLCTAGGVSAMAISGQLAMVAAIPALTRLYSPADFGVFAIYLSVVNILGAIAALRFEPSLYVAIDKTQAHFTLKLIVLAVCATSALTLSAGYLWSGTAPEQLRHLAYFIPVGMAGAGLGEAMNCWSLRFGYLRDFAIGRLVLPASMALLQLGFGLAQLGGAAMILAHILSQIVFIGFLCTRILTWEDIRSVARSPWRAVVNTARREYKFPLFDAPAALANFAINNLPTILIGSLFGTAFAGQFGVAARLMTSPIALIAIPLSNAFVAQANKSRNGGNGRKLVGIGRSLLLLTAGLIAVPILGLGFAAPYLVVPLLGHPWMLAGRIMAALAFMGAAQALATPLQEVPTLLRRQEVRLLVDAVRASLVFGPLLIGARAGWNPLHVIYLMAAGGAAGFVLRATASLFLLITEGLPAGATPQPL